MGWLLESTSIYSGAPLDPSVSNSDSAASSLCLLGTAAASTVSYVVPTFSEAVPLDPSWSTSSSTYSPFCLSETATAYTYSSIVTTL